MKRVAFALLFVCAVLQPALAQSVYRCPRYDGSTSFQDTPCVGMPSGGQPVVERAAPIHQAADDAVDGIHAAFERDVQHYDISPECREALVALGRSTLTLPPGVCAPRAAEGAGSAPGAAAR